MQELSYQPLAEFDFQELSKISGRAFADYITGPYQMTDEETQRLVESGYVDTQHSVVIHNSAGAVGYVLVSINGKMARVASMGIVPEFRGGGVGRAVLNKMKSDLKAQGFVNLELEVFEQNLPALHLYESLGFKKMRRLFGFTKENQTKNPISGVKSIDLNRAAALLAEFDDLEMPWQVSAWRVAQLTDRTHLAWTLNNDAVLVTPKARPDHLALTALMVRPGCRRRGLGRQLIHFIENEFSSITVRVPQLCPEEHRAFFEAMDFVVLPLNQIQMRVVL